MGWDALPPDAGKSATSWDALPPNTLQDRLDKYWKSGMGPVPEAPTLNDAQAGLEHSANAATFHHLPQLQAAAEKLVDPNTDYVSSRDANIARLAQEEKESPRAVRAGTVLGYGGNALLTGGALKAAGLMGGAPGVGKLAGEALEGPATSGASRLKAYLDAAKVGGAMGAANNPGDTAGEVDPLQIAARGKNAAMGVPLGLAGQGATELLSGIPAAASNLKELANEKAFKVLGAGKRAFKEAFNKDQVQGMGRQLLDEGLVTPLTTPKALATRVEAAKDSAGEHIGSLLDQVDAANAKNAAGQSAASGVSPEVQAEMQKFGLNGPAKPGAIDAKALASELRSGPEAKFLGATPGMEGASGKLNSALDTLEKNGDLNLRQAQSLRQGIDKSINFGKRVPDMTGAQQGLYEIRDALRNKMNDVVNESSQIAASGQKDALIKANRRYSALAQMDKILDDKIAQDAANRTVSLGDHISGGTGAAIGAHIAGPAGAAVGGLTGGLVSKTGRTFGNSLMATGSDKLADILAKLPGLGQVAQNNPGELQSILASLAGPQTVQHPTIMQAPVPIINSPLSGPSKLKGRSPALRLKALGE